MQYNSCLLLMYIFVYFNSNKFVKELILIFWFDFIKCFSCFSKDSPPNGIPCLAAFLCLRWRAPWWRNRVSFTRTPMWTWETFHLRCLDPIKPRRLHPQPSPRQQNFPVCWRLRRWWMISRPPLHLLPIMPPPTIQPIQCLQETRNYKVYLLYSILLNLLWYLFFSK